MKIRQFTAEGVHGYLDLQVDFYPDLTFLTGINGSGKTTVVSGLFALIAPQLSRLVRLQFDQMRVSGDGEAGPFEVSAERDGPTLQMTATGAEAILEVPLLDDESGFDYRDVAESDKFYRDFETRHASHPVLRTIKSLPSPMFLGLDRRHWEVPDSDHRMRVRSAYIRRNRRNVFGSSLTSSLLDADFLAREFFNSLQAEQRSLADRLRTDLILGAIEFEERPRKERMPRPISPADLSRIRYTLHELGISGDALGDRLDIFASRLNQIVENLPEQARLSEDFPDLVADLPPNQMHAVLEWTVNRPQFDRLSRIMKHVQTYVREVQALNRPIDRYLEVVNNFLGDSGKSLHFGATGGLEVQIEDTLRPVSALSSGESQLVVILSHLAFNPAAKEANVFIIDEPELSLHLRWQELFVDAVSSVNQDLQAVMATHSPAIVLDRVDRCVDLGGRAG